MTKKTFVILLLITLLGGFLRLYKLAEVPIALTGDEVAFGYNAFAILNTLKDEHGEFLPLSFKSFGDYKPPFYVYLLVPFIAVLGLTETAVRLPAALSGTLLIPLIFFACKYFFKNKIASLLSAILIAISPWAINFSRGGFEAMVAVLFITLGVLLFTYYSKKTLAILGSLFLFLLSMYTYHAQKIVGPLLFSSLVFLNWQNIKVNRKVIVFGLLLILIMMTPLLLGLTNESGKSRARGALVTTYLEHPTMKKNYDSELGIIGKESGISETIFHPYPVLGINDMLSKVYAYFSPAQIFVYGDEVKRHGSEDIAVLYLFEFFLIIAGSIYLIRLNPKGKVWIIIFWLIVGFIPAMITRDRLHSIRSLSAIVPLYIIEGVGLWFLFTFLLNFFKSRYVKWISWFRISLICLIAGIITVSLIHYLLSYFIYSPIKRASDWQYGYKQMVQVLSKEQNRFDQIIIDNPKAYGNPYIFILFYQQIHPNELLKTVKREDDIKNKVSAVPSFGKFVFKELYWPTERSLKKTLFVGTDLSLPKQDVNEPDKMRIVDEIKMPDGEVVFRIVETY